MVKKLLILLVLLGVLISGCLVERSIETKEHLADKTQNETGNTNERIKETANTAKDIVEEFTGNNQVYLSECANSLSEAKDKIQSPFKIIITTEEQKYFLINAYYQVEEKKYLSSYYVPRCDYIELLSDDNPSYEIEESQCNNAAYSILKVSDIDKIDALNGVIFYWNMLNSQVYGYNLTFNSVNEKGNDFVVTLRYTSFLGGDWGMCDYWSVWEDDYCVNKNNGKISLNKRKILETEKGECH